MSLDSNNSPIPPEAYAPVPAAVECPGCGAKVRAVRAEPGEKIRCLNCGTRFVPFQLSAESIEKPSILNEETQPKIREPRSAGYWLLRIPATLYFAGTTLAYAIFVAALMNSLIYETYSSRVWEFFLGMVYLPLLPLSGYFAFVTTRSLARLETHTLKAAWNEKLIQSALPAVKGSSLPYILPLAVGPVVLFIVLAVMSARDSARSININLESAGLASLGSFLLGFMIDDLRQFTSRQKSIAVAFARTDATPIDKPLDSRFPWLGVLPTLTVISFALFFSTICYQDYAMSKWYRMPTNSDTLKAEFFFVLTLLSWGITLFLTGRNIRNAVNAWWRAAARSMGSEQDAERERTAPDTAALRMHRTMFAFILVGSLTVIYSAMSFYDCWSKYAPDQFDLFFARVLPLVWCLMFMSFAERQDRDSNLSPWTCRKGFILLVCIAGATAFFRPFRFRTNGAYYRIEEVIMLWAMNTGFFLCAALYHIYADVRKWRAAQTLFWQARIKLSARVVLSKTPHMVMIGTVALVAIQSVALAVTLCNQILIGWGRSNPIRWEEIMLVPLLLLMAHFPTVWVALVCREFLLAEETAAQARATTDARIAAQYYS